MNATATFYDHAKNLYPVEASAVARARRVSKAEGRVWTVTANWKGQAPFYWDGCTYDAIALAKQLVFNNAESVTLERYDGTVYDAAAIREMRYSH